MFLFFNVLNPPTFKSFACPCGVRKFKENNKNLKKQLYAT